MRSFFLCVQHFLQHWTPDVINTCVPLKRTETIHTQLRYVTLRIFSPSFLCKRSVWGFVSLLVLFMFFWVFFYLFFSFSSASLTVTKKKQLFFVCLLFSLCIYITNCRKVKYFILSSTCWHLLLFIHSDDFSYLKLWDLAP